MSEITSSQTLAPKDEYLNENFVKREERKRRKNGMVRRWAFQVNSCRAGWNIRFGELSDIIRRTSTGTSGSRSKWRRRIQDACRRNFSHSVLVHPSETSQVDSDYYTPAGGNRKGDKVPDGRALVKRVTNDGCSDQRVLSACSSKPRRVHASDTRLFGLSRSRRLATSCVNSLISIIG